MIIVFAKDAISIARKVCTYVQSEWKKFIDIYGDSLGAEQHTDPALTAHIKGEDQLAGSYPQTTSKDVESHCFKKTTQQTNKTAHNYKERGNTSSSKQKIVRLIIIDPPPPPVGQFAFKKVIVQRAEDSAPTQQVSSGINFEKTVAGGHNSVYRRKDTPASKDYKRRTKLYLYFLFVGKALINALLFVLQKTYAYAQHVLEDFRDIHGDSVEDLPYTEPAFIAYLKGDEGAPFIDNPHKRFSKSTSADSEILKNRNQSQQQKGNLRSKLHLQFVRAGNALVNALLLVPRKIYAYVQRVLEDFNDIHGDSTANLPYTEPAFIAYLKGEEGAPFIDNPHIKFSTSASSNLKNVSADSEIVESGNQRQEQNENVTKGVILTRLIKRLYCHIRRTILTFNSQKEDKASGVDRSHQAEKLHETAAKHSRSAHPPPAHVATSERCRLITCFGVPSTAWNWHAPNNPMDTGPKLFSSPQQSGVRKEHLNASSPFVGKQAEMQAKLPTKGKAHREVIPPSSLTCKADSAAKTLADHKPKGKKMTPRIMSSSRVDVSAPTPSNSGLDTGPKLFSSPQPFGVRKEQINTSPSVGKDKAHREDMPPSLLASEAESAATTLVDQKPKGENMPPRIISSAHVHVSAPTPSNSDLDTAPKLVSSCNASPTVAKRAGRQVKLSAKGKARRKVVPPSSLASKADSASRIQECKSKRKNEERERVTQVMTSPSHVDAYAPTPPAEEQTKRKAMPAVFQTAHQQAPAQVQAPIREEKSPIVAYSGQVWSTNNCSDSQVFQSQTIETCSVKEHFDAGPTVSKGKRAMSEEESEEESWNVQDTNGRTENPPSESRNTKRKAEGRTGTNSKSSPTRNISRRRHRLHAQRLENATSVEAEPMEVVESPPEKPFIGPPEPMETGGEEYAVVFPFGGLGEPNQTSVTGSFVEQKEQMDVDQEPSGISFRECESEPMETNQGTVFNDLSFAWENVMQSFLYKPVEEMETDINSAPATPCVAQLEAIMETMQEPVIMPMPSGQFENFQWPVGTGVKTSEATFTVPQEQTLQTNQELADGCKTLEAAFGDLSVVSRPFAFSVGALNEENTSTKTPAVEQAVVQPVLKPARLPPIMKTDTQPSTQSTKKLIMEELLVPEDPYLLDDLDSASEQTMPPPLVETETQPLTQSANQLTQTVEELLVPEDPYLLDGLDSDSERTASPPLAETETQPSTQLSAKIYSEHLQRMEGKLNDETSFAEIEQQALVTVETEQADLTNQFANEELLVPEDSYLPDGLDSESDDEDSDDEYELDMATIDKFLELDAEPEHIQLINKLLTEKELASE